MGLWDAVLPRWSRPLITKRWMTPTAMGRRCEDVGLLKMEQRHQLNDLVVQGRMKSPLWFDDILCFAIHNIDFNRINLATIGTITFKKFLSYSVAGTNVQIYYK